MDGACGLAAGVVAGAAVRSMPLDVAPGGFYAVQRHIERVAGADRDADWARTGTRIDGPGWHVADMTRSTRLDRAALSETLRLQLNVIGRRQALACGMTRDALMHRLRPGGPWQRLLPGAYLAVTGTPTFDQKEMAALLYAGPRSVLTGRAALRVQGLSNVAPGVIDVLVPASRQCRSLAFAAIHRTTRMPAEVIGVGSRSYARVPRAIADTARGMADLREVRALVAGAVQQGQCPLGMLLHELEHGPVSGAALLRQVLAEVAEGVRSVAEADFMDLIKRARLPVPLFNARLYDPDGSLIAMADAWWPRSGVAAEVDSREWHLSPADWERTRRRHAQMSRHGIIVLHFSPREIRTDSAAVITAIASALKAGSARPALPVTARRAS